MRSVRVWIFFIALACAANAEERERAGADDPVPEPHTVPKTWTDPGGAFDPQEPKPRTEHRWYGWQILLVDLTSLGLIAWGAKEHSDSRLMVGLGGYVLGGPVVHGTHAHTGKAFGSLGLRIGLPVVAAVVGAKLEDCPETEHHLYEQHYCGVRGAITGLIVGAALAAVTDATVMAHDEVAPARLVIRPDVRVQRDRAEVSLAAMF